MNNLSQNRSSIFEESSIPKRGNLWVRSGHLSKRPAEDSNELDSTQLPCHLEGEAKTGYRQRGPRPGQMNFPGIGFPYRTSVTHSRFTFDRFVVGPCNQFAYEASRVVASEKGNPYNPFYLYGGSGLGKSHLAGAIGNHITVIEPTTRIVYVTAEGFVNEMVTAIRKNGMGEFKEKYRQRCDVLFIDGVHFFSGKKTTQTELSHTFDHLYNSSKRIVLTGAVPPHELTHMTDNLRSRLAVGLVVDIQPPDIETRKRILLHKASFEGVSIGEDVLDLLASQVFGNVRRLEGLLVNLIAKSSLLCRPINLELALEVIGSLQKAENHQVTIDRIQSLVAQQYHLEVDQLVSRSRRKSVCYPRQLAMYLCRKFTNESLDAIGRAYRRDHASVIHSIGVIEKQMREKARVRREIDFLVQKLGLQEY